ncbi:MAG: hypothetical protein U0103_08880 [Candidatus Obscuribacterales bacterium]|nr:hypothetical protein [Cyanobacteria bacterium SZAS LIN-5]RTL45373.1 MAG: hypothetical protein EKK48_02750 [Candidatus Melainabacteria bacterium]
MPPAKIFVAVKSEPLATVVEALHGYELCIADNVQHGMRLLNEQHDIDIFIIGILFDDSKAMDLIKRVSSRKTATKQPILVVRLMSSQHEEVLKSTMKTMIELKIVKEYLEVLHTHPGAKRMIRNLVEKYLPDEKLAAT